MRKIFGEPGALLALELAVGKTWVVALALLFFTPLVVGMMPGDGDPLFAATLRSQTAAVVGVALCCLWMPVIAVRAGRAQIRRNLRFWYAGRGMSNTRYFLSLFLALDAYIAVLGAGVALSQMIYGGAGLWLAIQIFWCFWVPAMFLSALGVGLAQRVDETVGGLLTVALGLYGYFGIYAMDAMRRRTELGYFRQHLADAIWSVSPQLNLFDLTDRVIFQHGAVLFSGAAGLLVYGIVLVAAAVVAGNVLFNVKNVLKR